MALTWRWQGGNFTTTLSPSMQSVQALKVLSYSPGTPLRALQPLPELHYHSINPHRSSPEVTTAPVHGPLPLSPAYKKRPQHCKRAHNTTLSLPDIITPSHSLSVAQELDSGAPRTRRSAAVPERLLQRRLLEPSEKTLRSPLDTSSPLAAAAGEFPDHHHSPRHAPSPVPVAPRMMTLGRRIRF
jgi:hypothetical protein